MCIRDRVGQFQALNGIHGVVHAMGGAFRFLSAQHHFRVVQEIAVDGKAVLRLSGLGPLWCNVQRTVTLLQENDVRNDLCTSVFLESVIGQTDGSQQLGTLSKICLLYTSRCV